MPISKKKPLPAPPPSSTPCPFTIIADANEFAGDHRGWIFEGIPSHEKTKGLPFDVPLRRDGHLDNLGDYTIESSNIDRWDQPRIVIDRKSKADLFQSVVKRDNFEWRLERMTNETESAHIVVEAELSDMYRNPPPHTEMAFKSVHHTIQSWSQRFKGVHWWFYEDRQHAEAGAFWLMWQFHQNVTRHKLDRDLGRETHAAYLKGMIANRKKVKVTDNPYAREHGTGGHWYYWALGWNRMADIAVGKEPNPHDRLIFPQRDIMLEDAT